MFPFYEETGSEKVTHCFKDSVAEIENANIRIPKQMMHLERRIHNTPWEFRTGRDHCRSRAQGSFHGEGEP